MLYSPPKWGKTNLAATIDETKGEDTIWVMFDNNGTNGLLGSEYNVRYLLDVPELRFQKNWTVPQVTKEVFAAIKQLTSSEPDRPWKIIFDGISVFDSWVGQECPQDSAGKPEWARYKAYHQDFINKMVALPYPKVLIAHSAVDVGDVRSPTKNEDAKLASGAVEGEVIKPLITGSALALYQGISDVIAFLQKYYNPKGEAVYKLLTDGGEKARGGNRFARYLPREVVNANLSALTDEIKSKVSR
jgi:hypothetical protein